MRSMKSWRWLPALAPSPTSCRVSASSPARGARLDAELGSPGLDLAEDGHEHAAAEDAGSVDEAHAHLVEALLRPAESGGAPVRIAWRMEPTCSADVRARLGRTSTYEARFVAPRPQLEKAARAFAEALRSSAAAEVWTSGWIRDAERHDAARK